MKQVDKIEVKTINHLGIIAGLIELMGLSLLVYTLGQRQRASQPKTAQNRSIQQLLY